MADPAAPRVRVFACSDLHTDHSRNAKLVASWCGRVDLVDENYVVSAPDSSPVVDADEDSVVRVLIVAGDVSKRLSVLRRTLLTLKEYGPYDEVFFCPGNNELRLDKIEDSKHGIKHSLEKLDAVLAVCEELGVHTTAQLIAGVLIVPIIAWYSPYFSAKFDAGDTSYQRRWLDFREVVWPKDMALQYCSARNGLKVEASGSKKSLSSSRKSASMYENDVDGAARFLERQYSSENVAHAAELAASARSVLTFSHFLPRIELLPPMTRNPTLQFVAGDTAIETQLRTVSSSLHIFGHTHWQSSTTIDGVKYVQHPLAHPKERTGVYPARIAEPLLVLDTEQSRTLFGRLLSWFGW